MKETTIALLAIVLILILAITLILANITEKPVSTNEDTIQAIEKLEMRITAIENAVKRNRDMINTNSGDISFHHTILGLRWEMKPLLINQSEEDRQLIRKIKNSKNPLIDLYSDPFNDPNTPGYWENQIK